MMSICPQTRPPANKADPKRRAAACLRAADHHLDENQNERAFQALDKAARWANLAHQKQAHHLIVGLREEMYVFDMARPQNWRRYLEALLETLGEASGEHA